MNYKCISENYLLMDNKHRKLFVITQSGGCKFMPKMHLAAIGPTSKGEEREGREERGDGKGGEGNRLPPKSRRVTV